MEKSKNYWDTAYTALGSIALFILYLVICFINKGFMLFFIPITIACSITGFACIRQAIKHKDLLYFLYGVLTILTLIVLFKVGISF